MAKSDLRKFDYKKVAELDAKMWRSYYNHQFLKMFFQLLKIMRTQLKLNWFNTFRLAYYSGLAATDYRLRKGRENYPKTKKNLIKFYKVISDNCLEPFDYTKTGILELEWWDIHRYPKKYKKTLELSLAETMAAMYNDKPTNFKEYSHYRAVAMLMPRHEGDKQENPPDWNEIRDLLLKSWGSAFKAVQK